MKNLKERLQWAKEKKEEKEAFVNGLGDWILEAYDQGYYGLEDVEYVYRVREEVEKFTRIIAYLEKKVAA